MPSHCVSQSHGVQTPQDAYHPYYPYRQYAHLLWHVVWGYASPHVPALQTRVGQVGHAPAAMKRHRGAGGEDLG